MPASYTSSLRLIQPATGDYPGDWGNQVNNGITALVDSAVAGTANISIGAGDYTLSNNNGASDEARAMFLNLTAGTGAGARNVICPAVSKLYFINNNSGFAQTIKTASGTGISVPDGMSTTVRCDGTNVVSAQNYFGSLTLGAALPIASGGTGSTSTTYCSLTTNVTGTLPVANGGTGLTTFTAANRIPYASGTTTLTTSAGLTFDGTNFVTTGTATAGSFIPSSSTVPTNGMYLRVANTLSWSTNSGHRMSLLSNGQLYLNTTTDLGGKQVGFIATNSFNGAGAALFYGGNNNTAAATPTTYTWNPSTSGDSAFAEFATEATYTARGSIDYNRAGGLVRYNTTSDYRAKDIIGPVQNPGATIDALKVYEGVMKGATQSRPMLVAHEAQAVVPYAVSGVKDEVNEDGSPKFQQIDVSSLVPLLLAEIQSLRARVAALEAA